MSFTSWLQNFTSVRARQGKHNLQKRRARHGAIHRLSLEPLEDRLTPSLQLVGYYVGNEPSPPPPPLFADVTSDGIPDLIDTNGQNSALVVRPGRGDGTLGDPIYSAAPTGSDLVLADFNDDGRLDVFTVAPAGAAPDFVPAGVVLLGRGDGTFYEAQTIGIPLDPISGFVVMDYGNGRPGVYVSGYDYYYDVYYTADLQNDGNWPPVPPPGPSFTIHDSTVTEGNTGTAFATITITLSTASTQTITVAYATDNGTATAGSDYQAAGGTLTFAPGETSKTVTVLVNGDRLGEPNETFVVNLSGATNVTIADGQGIGTIVDDEPRISISDVSKSEGKKNQTTLFTFTVILSVASDQPVTVAFRTVDDTAKTSDSDYVAKTGTLTFAPGETTKTITIEVKGDNKKEADETFYLDLLGNSSNSQFSRNRGIGTILNDD